MKMQSVALNEICRLAKRNVDPSRQPNRIFAHYSIPAFDDGERPVIEQGQLILSAKTVVPERAVLFSKLNPRIPRVWLVTDELEPSAICSTEFLPLVPDETKCDRRYLAWNLRSPRFTSGLQGGTAAATKSRERVNPEQVLSARIPLPSLSEQRRIADAIDAAMAEAEAASHAAEAQGKFVQKVRAAVFVDLLEQEESEREVAPLLDLCLGNGQYGLSLKASSVPLGLPILRMGNIQHGRLDWSDLMFVSVDNDIATHYGLQPGDILFNRTNSAELVGKAALVDEARKAVFASYLVRFRADTAKSDPRYLVEVINSPIGRRYIEHHMGRAIGQVNISASKMHAFPVPCPTVERQRRIMDQLNIIDEAVRIAEAALTAQRVALDALPSAILTAAFQGQL